MLKPEIDYDRRMPNITIEIVTQSKQILKCIERARLSVVTIVTTK